MTNGNYEKLVEQITDLVLSKIGGDGTCPTFCRADVERIVDAGASRIGIVLGETATAHDWASLIDHTLLKPEASESDIKKLCSEAIQFGFASVCVNPSWVKAASEYFFGPLDSMNQSLAGGWTEAANSEKFFQRCHWTCCQ